MIYLWPLWRAYRLDSLGLIKSSYVTAHDEDEAKRVAKAALCQNGYYRPADKYTRRLWIEPAGQVWIDHEATPRLGDPPIYTPDQTDIEPSDPALDSDAEPARRKDDRQAGFAMPSSQCSIGRVCYGQVEDGVRVGKHCLHVTSGGEWACCRCGGRTMSLPVDS